MLDETELLTRVDRRFVSFVSPTAPRIQAGGPVPGALLDAEGREAEGSPDRGAL